MLSTRDSPALVGGAVQVQTMEQITVKALRGFMHNGKPVDVGAVVDVSASVARGLVAMNKAECVPTAPAQVLEQPEDQPEDQSENQPEAPRKRGRPPKE